MTHTIKSFRSYFIKHTEFLILLNDMQNMYLKITWSSMQAAHNGKQPKPIHFDFVTRSAKTNEWLPELHRIWGFYSLAQTEVTCGETWFQRSRFFITKKNVWWGFLNKVTLLLISFSTINRKLWKQNANKTQSKFLRTVNLPGLLESSYSEHHKCGVLFVYLYFVGFISVPLWYYSFRNFAAYTSGQLVKAITTCDVNYVGISIREITQTTPKKRCVQHSFENQLRLLMFVMSTCGGNSAKLNDLPYYFWLQRWRDRLCWKRHEKLISLICRLWSILDNGKPST